jgi:ActR/RegA family two-component response regulator
VKPDTQQRLLFVDDEPTIRVTMAAILASHGFDVSTASTVSEALQKITSQQFEVLVSDLNIGNPGDGLTVVSAMRRTQPDAITMILTGYPAFETALEAIRQQVDDYIVKPADIPSLVKTIENKLSAPSRQHHLPPPKRVAMLLQEYQDRIEHLWFGEAEQEPLLARILLRKEQRLDQLRIVLREVIGSAQSHAESGAPAPRPQFGIEGYTPATLLAEFCVLRRVLARVVQENLLAVNLSYVVPDLARVNESLDEQTKAALAALLKHGESSVH